MIGPSKNRSEEALRSAPVPQTTGDKAGARGASYGQILKSSSLIGGAQGINYLIGLIRVKIVAVLLGPSGVGLVGLYMSATTFVSTLAQMGINQSGIREVAEAHGSGDAEGLARNLKTIRRACWITGIFGWVLTAALAYPLSLWTFGSGKYTPMIAILGSTLLLNFLAGGQTALLQGTMRIGDVARSSVLSAILSTIVAVGIYWFFGERGIVPVLVSTAVASVFSCWWFTRRVPVQEVQVSWSESWCFAKRLFGLGFAVMWSGLVGAAVALAVRSLILRKLGIEANGVYQAAWAISGMFGNFIITAMGTDFYPRLTAVADNAPEANRLVNEQTEIGMLLALPGLLGTLTFAPWLMDVFYTHKFREGAALLPFFVISVFCRTITYPMGWILFAKRASGRFASITTMFHICDISCCAALIPWLGLRGVAITNTTLCVIYLFGMRGIAGPLTTFSWSRATKKLIFVSIAWGCATLAMKALMPPVWSEVVGGIITASAALVCLRGVLQRVGPSSRLSMLVSRLPGSLLLTGSRLNSEQSL
jgi:enterobacterial common antigen flippase